MTAVNADATKLDSFLPKLLDRDRDAWVHDPTILSDWTCSSVRCCGSGELLFSRCTSVFMHPSARAHARMRFEDQKRRSPSVLRDAGNIVL